MDLKQALSVTLLAAIAATPSLAQSPVAPSSKFAWSENCGYINLRPGTNCVRVHGSFLSGYAWGENIGWINFGDGTPANLVSYANISGADFGVNHNTGTGALTGYAWGENVGWINFSGGAMAIPPDRARIETFPALRLRGYAWGENIGWVNLNFLICIADFDDGSGTGTPDGGVGIEDLLYYLDIYDAGLPAADIDDGSGTGIPDGGLGIEDLLYYLFRYEVGC